MDAARLGLEDHFVVKRTNVVPFLRATLPPGASRMLGLVASPTTVRDLVATSGLPSYEAVVALRALVVRHLVRVEG